MRLPRPLTIAVVFATVAAGHTAASGVVTAAAPRTAATPAAATAVVPFLQKHCVKCHGATRKEGGLALHTLTASPAGASGKTWRAVLARLRAGDMPPPGQARPDPAQLRRVTGWIAGELEKSGAPEPVASGAAVDHVALFDPKTSAPLDVRPRFRTLSPFNYTELIRDLAKNTPVAQPFSPQVSGAFQDVGDAAVIDEPTTQQLIRNAQAIAEVQTRHTVQDGRIQGVNGSVREFIALLDANAPLGRDAVAAAIRRQFELVLKRQPSAEETARFAALYERSAVQAGQVAAARTMLAAVLLLPEALYRSERGEGPPDAQGRVRLSPREIAFAIAYTLTDRRPDAPLLAAAEAGQLATREGVEAQVHRLLEEPRTPKPRLLRFFREYFGYGRAVDVFKDSKDFKEHDARVLVSDTDRMVEQILAEDRNVVLELLTTRRSFVNYSVDNKTKQPKPASGRKVHLAYNLETWPEQQPVELPEAERAGILTQPSWLVAQSLNADNHPILRGKWVRERLLGGSVPDLPITVDAQLPDDPTKTLRTRMEVTRQSACWSCHQRMNPLGLTFESFDHFGRFRTTELDRPVDASGLVDGVGDKALEGPVANAVEMIRRLAASTRTEQVFVRHAFRYWLGRNETLGDARSLQGAHRAYRESGGSMKALIVALLASDSFLYRVPATSRPRTQSPSGKPQRLEK